MAVIAAIFIACRNVMNITNLDLLTISKDHTKFEVNCPTVVNSRKHTNGRTNRQTVIHEDSYSSNATGELTSGDITKNIGHDKQIKAATIGPPAKRHSNGVSLVSRSWLDIVCWLGSSCAISDFSCTTFLPALGLI